MRFTFAPEADDFSESLQNFTIEVRKGDEIVASHMASGPDASAYVDLPAGRFNWSVKWQSSSGKQSSTSKSEVLVAPTADVWAGVPWLGASDANEFSANVTNLAEDAELLVATLGFGYVTVNGKDISEEFLSYSGWTATEKRVLYRSFPIGKLLDGGHAVVKVSLGCGYRCDAKGQDRFPAYHDDSDRSQDTIPKIFRLQIQSGEKTVFHSGSDGWMSREGPVVDDSVYDGEIFDPSAVTAWQPAKQLPEGWGPKGAMVAATFPGVKASRTDKPLKVSKVSDTVHVVDFGSNVAGVCRLTVPAVPSPPTCDVAGESDQLALSCKEGVISKVVFASFGTPEGGCDAGFSQGSCHAGNSQQAVESLCLGQTGCTVSATNDAFGGDPCENTAKKLAVQVECAVPAEKTCDVAAEDAPVSLTCSSGSISKVVFASFGTPSGSCDAGLSQGECHAEKSQQLLEQQCLGKAACRVDASNDVFGDPCYQTVKQLTVQVECGGPPAPAPLGSVSMRHGELMQHSGLPDVASPDPSRVHFANLRSAQAKDTVFVAEPMIYMPRFTYHGFRYVEVYNFPGDLKAEHIERMVMHTANADKTDVHFDDETLQAIHEGARGSQRSNLMQVPTDCPQRDERLGWMGDMSLSADSMLAHFDMGPMAAAFVDSMVDEMGDDGSFPDVVPFQRFGGRPADLSWSSAFLSTLVALWQEGDDLDTARRHWPAVNKHLANLQAQYAQAGALTKLPEPYGDWCPPPATQGQGDKETPSKGFAAAFSLTRTVQQAADIGTALGGDAAETAKTFAKWAQSLRQEFHDGFYNAAEKRYDNGAMITNVLPLALGAVPDSEKAAIVQNLLDHIAAKNGTWSGGIINNRFLFDVLYDNGHGDVALSMLKRRDYPSYGYMYFNELEPAKECMWELPDAPFQGIGMNSRNHHMFSSVGHYLVSKVAGLSRGSDGLRAVVGSEPKSKATLHTATGDVHFSWRRESSGLSVSVEVPLGQSVKLHVPVTDGSLNKSAELQGKFHVVELAPGSHQLATGQLTWV